LTIDALICPSDSGVQKNRDRGKNSYVVNHGDRATELENRNFEQGRGVFLGVRPLNMAHLKDGTSNTIVFCEILNSLTYGGDRLEVPGMVIASIGGIVAAPSVCLATLDPTDRRRFATGAAGRRRGDRWADGRPAFTGFQTILPPNSPCVQGTNTEDINNAIYSVYSAHPGGVQACMADSSVKFISDTIDTGNLALPAPGPVTTRSPYGIWGAIGTRGAGETAQLP